MLGKLSGYTVSVLITAVVGVLSMPIVIATVGASIWTSVAVAQAAGFVAGALVSYGWPVVGPAQVAAGDHCERGRLFANSLVTRLLLLPVAVVGVGVFLFFLPPGTMTAAVAIAALIPILNSLGFAWFFVGEAQPLKFNLLEVIPRSAGTVVGMFAVVSTRDILAFVLAQLAGQMLTLIVSTTSIWRRYTVPPLTEWIRGVKSSLVDGFAGFVTSATTTTYQNLPVILVAALAPPQAVTFTMADKVYRLATVALVPVTQVAQGYVPAGGTPTSLFVRARRAVRSVSGLALVSAVAFGALCPVAAIILSAGQVSVGPELSIPFGAALGVILLSSVIGRACLVPFGESRTLMFAALCSAGFGVAGVAIATLIWGAVGAAIALLLAEIVGLVIVSARLRECLRRSAPPHVEE